MCQGTTELYNPIWRCYRDGIVSVYAYDILKIGASVIILKFSARFWGSIFSDVLGSIMCCGICLLFVYVTAILYLTSKLTLYKLLVGMWGLFRVLFLWPCRYFSCHSACRFNYSVYLKKALQQWIPTCSQFWHGIACLFPWSVHTTCLSWPVF
jgi:hypothetical protein